MELFALVECREGYTRDSDSGDCVACPIGTYSDTVEATSCTSCAEGESTRYTATGNARLCIGNTLFCVFFNFFIVLDNFHN